MKIPHRCLGIFDVLTSDNITPILREKVNVMICDGLITPGKKQLNMSIPVATPKDSPSLSAKDYPAFGCSTPYAEPLWYSRNVSPHYTESHRKLRAAIRTYVDEEILPYAFEWESAGKVPDKVRETPFFQLCLTRSRLSNAM
jgi:hypothetical protein